MSFATKVLAQIHDRTILREAETIRFHKIGAEVFEIVVDGQSFLLTTDAGIDFSFGLAEFLSSMEQCR
jgi:hypothetical protein